MNKLKRTKIINTNNGMSIGVDILSKSDKYMKVVIDNMNVTIELHKKAPNDKNYTGHTAGMEFSTTGEEDV